eukprot:GILK01008454.1.p1 GENE.GILK01008454.1~~GILK01008454.1.p1  ORF type:complete len:416 (+),score=29.03 GILK01008454.1:38-1285(+)
MSALAKCFCLSAVVRLILFVSGFHTIFFRRVELIPPNHNFTRLKEGLFLWSYDHSPYEGGLAHQPPLILLLFRVLQSLGDVGSFLFLLCVDLCSGFLLFLICREHFKDPKKDRQAVLIACTYILHPFVVAENVALSTHSLVTATVLGAILAAHTNRTFLCAVSLAAASYLSMYPLLLMPSLALLLLQSRGLPCTFRHFCSIFVPFSVYVVMVLAVLAVASFMILGSWEFLSAVYGFVLALNDLTPNVGIFWYFFTEVFDRFRHFFVVVFHSHVLVYVIPIALRLQSRPLFAVTVQYAIAAIFFAYPTAADAAIILPLIFLHQDITKTMRGIVIIVNGLLVPITLAPLMWHMWLDRGSGNANFFYNQVLCFMGFEIFLVLEATGSYLRMQYRKKTRAMCEGLTKELVNEILSELKT